MALLDNILRPFGLATARNVQQATAELVELRSTLSNPEQWLSDWFTGGISGSGVAVNEQTALSLSAVYACCRIRSAAVASLSLGLFRRLDNGDIEEVTDLPEYTVVCEEPHSLYTRYTFDSTTMLHESLHGNSYSHITYGRSGRVSKIKILNRECVTPFLKDDTLWYRYMDEYGQQHIYADWEILHFKNFSTDGIIGKSPIQVCRETFGQPISAMKYTSSMYNNGGYVKGVVEAQKPLNKQQLQDLRANFISVLRDYESTSGIAILGDGMTYKQMSMSPKDMEYIAAAKLSVADISRIYGIPLHMLSEMDKASFSNIEHQSIEYVMHSIRPIVKNREAELNRRILRSSDKGKLFFRYNLDSMMRGDSAARGAYVVQMLQNGVYNIDDARKLDNMNQLPNGIGKAHYRPLNMVEVGKEPDPALLNNDPAATGVQNTDGNGVPQAAE